jgi:hypothetical protein
MATPNASFEALRGEGFTGSLSDMRRQNLLSLLSLSEPQGTNNDLELRYWRQLGGIGSIMDARHRGRTNLAVNPGYESGTNSFFSNFGTFYAISADTVAPISGVRSALLTRQVAGASTTIAGWLLSTGAAKIPVTPGQPITGGVSIKTDVANAQIRTRWYWYDAGSVLTSTPSVIRVAAATPGQVYRVTETGTPLANSVTAYFVIEVTNAIGNTVGGEKVWADMLTLEYGTTDGSWF